MNNPLYNIFQARNAANNQLGNILAALQNGQNPIALLQTFSPQLAQTLAGKSPQEIEAYVRNLCVQRGLNPDQMAQSISALMRNLHN